MSIRRDSIRKANEEGYKILMACYAQLENQPLATVMTILVRLVAASFWRLRPDERESAWELFTRQVNDTVEGMEDERKRDAMRMRTQGRIVK